MCAYGQLVFAMPQTFLPLTATRNDKTKWMNLLLEKIESPGSQRTVIILVLRGVTLLVCDFVQLVFAMPHTFLPLTETRNDKTKWMNLLLEKVESPGFQRTAVILAPRGVTLLVCGFGQLVFVMPQTFMPCTKTRNDKTRWMNLLFERAESPGSQHTAVILVSRGVTLLVCGFGQMVFGMPQTFVPFTETRNDKTKLMNLLFEKVESPGSQRTAVVLASCGVTLLVCGFGQLVFATPQTFVPLTATLNNKTKWMNLLLEKVELPGSQRTAVILVLRGVTLLVCGFGQLVFAMPQTFVPLTATRNDKTKGMNLLLEKVESPGSQRTAVILVLRGVTLLVCGFGQLVFVMPQTFVPFTETRNDKTKRMNLLLERVESPTSQRTAVILGLRVVTLLVCGFGQLVFVMPQTFVPFTETRNDKTKGVNLLLEKVESPGSQRTAVILDLRGVTLLVCVVLASWFS